MRAASKAGRAAGSVGKGDDALGRPVAVAEAEAEAREGAAAGDMAGGRAGERWSAEETAGGRGKE